MSKVVDSSSTKFAVEFSAVTKSFGPVTALKKIDLGIPDGQFISILGPSGCGKTTLLRLIAGFEQPTTGQLSIGGRPMGNVPPYRRPVNMVFQDYALFPNLDVFENVAYGLRGRMPRISKEDIERRVEQVLRTVEILDKSKRRTWQLSGGQQQRVALARAMVNEPNVLLLDEPMAALDKKLRRDVQFRLQSLQRQTGVTFIMVTHDQHEALSLSDQIIVMRDGKVEQVGTPESLYRFPISQFVANFIGDFNVLSGVVKSVGHDTVHISYNGRTVPVTIRHEANIPKVGDKLLFGFSPDVCKLVTSSRRRKFFRASIFGGSREYHFSGEKYELRIRGLRETDSDIIARLPVSDLRSKKYANSEQVNLEVEFSNLHMLNT